MTTFSDLIRCLVQAGLSGEEWRVLLALMVHEQGLRHKELGEQTKLAKGNVTRAIYSLKRRGLIYASEQVLLSHWKLVQLNKGLAGLADIAGDVINMITDGNSAFNIDHLSIKDQKKGNPEKVINTITRPAKAGDEDKEARAGEVINLITSAAIERNTSKGEGAGKVINMRTHAVRDPENHDMTPAEVEKVAGCTPEAREIASFFWDEMKRRGAKGFPDGFYWQSVAMAQKLLKRATVDELKRCIVDLLGDKYITVANLAKVGDYLAPWQVSQSKGGWRKGGQNLVGSDELERHSNYKAVSSRPAPRS
jgi:hypothetical protein